VRRIGAPFEGRVRGSCDEYQYSFVKPDQKEPPPKGRPEGIRRIARRVVDVLLIVMVVVILVWQVIVPAVYWLWPT
jgi:hypothetical protein